MSHADSSLAERSDITKIADKAFAAVSLSLELVTTDLSLSGANVLSLSEKSKDSVSEADTGSASGSISDSGAGESFTARSSLSFMATDVSLRGTDGLLNVDGLAASSSTEHSRLSHGAGQSRATDSVSFEFVTAGLFLNGALLLADTGSSDGGSEVAGKSLAASSLAFHFVATFLSLG